MLFFNYQMKEAVVATKQTQREGVGIFDKDTKEMLSVMKKFNPYMYKPDGDVLTC